MVTSSSGGRLSEFSCSWAVQLDGWAFTTLCLCQGRICPGKPRKSLNSLVTFNSGGGSKNDHLCKLFCYLSY